jgi:hypothetical protein
MLWINHKLFKLIYNKNTAIITPHSHVKINILLTLSIATVPRHFAIGCEMQGEVLLWDVHFRLSGSLGNDLNLQTHCPLTQPVVPTVGRNGGNPRLCCGTSSFTRSTPIIPPIFKIIYPFRGTWQSWHEVGSNLIPLHCGIRVIIWLKLVREYFEVNIVVGGASY